MSLFKRNKKEVVILYSADRLLKEVFLQCKTAIVEYETIAKNILPFVYNDNIYKEELWDDVAIKSSIARIRESSRMIYFMSKKIQPENDCLAFLEDANIDKIVRFWADKSDDYFFDSVLKDAYNKCVYRKKSLG